LQILTGFNSNFFVEVTQQIFDSEGVRSSTWRSGLLIEVVG